MSELKYCTTIGEESSKNAFPTNANHYPDDIVFFLLMLVCNHLRKSEEKKSKWGNLNFLNQRSIVSLKFFFLPPYHF